MNALTVPLDDNDKIHIGNCLEKLFMFQDRPFNKEKKAIFVEEVAKCGYPLAAILDGIRKLYHEDLKNLKLPTILDAISEKIIPTDELGVACDYCSKVGIITMRNPEKYEFALACSCANGDRFAKQGNTRWNGQRVQHSKKHGMMELVFADFILGKE